MSAQLSLFSAYDDAAGWHVRVSRRARRLSVRVYPGGRVEVVVPPGASPLTVQRFIGQHRAWIDRRVRDLAPGGVAHNTLPATVELRALCSSYPLSYFDSEQPVRVRTGESGNLIVSGTVHDRPAVSDALRRWLLRLAQHEFSEWVAQLSRTFNFKYERVQIRRQRTRWGSCSASGTISLNVCLSFLEPSIVRYLLIHELCHTRQMNHSAKFWALVAECEPDYRRLDRELSRGWQSVPGWMYA